MKDIQQDSKNLWHLYGNTYDLSEFLQNHPGGSQILEITKGHKDVTAMFESYHSFANIEEIKVQLSKYQVGKSDFKQLNTFEADGFYNVVRQRVRDHFGSEKSLTKKVKINSLWQIKVVLLVLIHIFSIYQAFFNNTISIYIQIFFAILSGTIKLSVGFIVFHDASHFALFSGKESYKNEIVARINGAVLQWSQEMWAVHHTFRHHCYTGNTELDPDMINTTPFYRKSIKELKGRYFNVPYLLLPHFVNFILFVFPGLFYGQIFSYWLMWARKQHLWRMSYPKQVINRRLYENCIFFFLIFIHIYRQNIFVSLAYAIASNTTYALAIVPDHDTNQTSLNHDDSKKDWGEMQVRNSANFLNQRFFDLYYHVFGGINYQIEHHLFPSMCGIHLKEIAPIVKMTCKEFDVPYVHHDNMFSAYGDFLQMVKRVY